MEGTCGHRASPWHPQPPCFGAEVSFSFPFPLPPPPHLNPTTGPTQRNRGALFPAQSHFSFVNKNLSCHKASVILG